MATAAYELDLHATASSLGLRPQLKPLRGHWTNEVSRGKAVFEIRGNLAMTRSGSVAIIEQSGHNSYNLAKPSGVQCRGELDGVGRLCWDDGRVWVRHEMAEGRAVRCVVCYGTGSRNPYDLVAAKVKCPHCFGIGTRSACHAARTWT
uniref:Uncharacterized protein n=1 Tax=Zooxanthella nutricula TaxID=1333877 RepID=A0A7S2J7V2_9DINO